MTFRGAALYPGQDGRIVEIASPLLRAAVVPSIGGSLARLLWTRAPAPHDILRPASVEAVQSGDVRRMALFPLIPFASFLVGAKFRFRGREFRLERNFPGRDVALHGDAWQHPWTVERRAADHVVLGYVQTGCRFPFRYRACQRIGLDGTMLTIEVELENTDAEDMPAGIGLHPFFPKKPGATLRLPASGVWRKDAAGVPTAVDLLPPNLDFSISRSVGDLEAKHFLAGWQGRAVVDWPTVGIRAVLEAAPVFQHVQLFAPPDGDFFCVEPCTNLADGFNLMDAGCKEAGVVVLPPGGKFAGAVRITVLPTMARAST